MTAREDFEAALDAERAAYEALPPETFTDALVIRAHEERDRFAALVDPDRWTVRVDSRFAYGEVVLTVHCTRAVGAYEVLMASYRVRPAPRPGFRRHIRTYFHGQKFDRRTKTISYGQIRASLARVIVERRSAAVAR